MSRISAVRTAGPSPASPGGGGNGWEPRVAVLESTVHGINDTLREIKADLSTERGEIRKLMYGLAGAAVLLTGALITGYLLLDNRLRDVQISIASHLASSAPTTSPPIEPSAAVPAHPVSTAETPIPSHAEPAKPR
jgi:hypothetical protein